MPVIIKKETWDFHCIGTDFTYKYNHNKGYMALCSESQKKIINVVDAKFRNLTDFQRECNQLFLYAVQEIKGWN